MEYINNEKQLERALEVFRTSLKSEFYSKKYEGIKEPASLQDWFKLPILERQEIFDNSYPQTKSMLTCDLTDMIIISTGGSSCVARYTTYSHKEWDAFAEMQSQAMKVLGVTPEDKVANLFIAGHFWPSFLGLHECIKKVGAVHLPISSNIPPEEIVKLCLQFEPTVMVSLPTLFVFLADLAQRDGFQFKNLRMIQYAGEHLSSQAEAHIKKHLNVPIIKSGAYTSADAGIMGYQCDHCPPGVYHIPSGFQFIEVINFETGEYTKPGEVGEIVVTNLSRTSTPIIRYRVGDAISFIGETCPCGDANPLIKLAGRAGMDFKIGGGFISLDTLEEAVGEFSDDFSMNYQLVLEDVDNKLKMNLNIECGKQPSKEKIEELRERLFEKIKEFKIGTEMGYISEFTINSIGLGTLPRSPITGKVRKVDDKRV